MSRLQRQRLLGHTRTHACLHTHVITYLPLCTHSRTASALNINNGVMVAGMGFGHASVWVYGCVQGSVRRATTSTFFPYNSNLSHSCLEHHTFFPYNSNLSHSCLEHHMYHVQRAMFHPGPKVKASAAQAEHRAAQH